MKGPVQPVRLHKTVVHNANGVLVRVCDGCGASWKLGPVEVGSQVLAWRPIAELTADGMVHPDVQIDILYCPADVTTVQTAQQTVTPEKPKVFCWCSTCRSARRQHYSGDDNCYCDGCRGKKPHLKV